ncbi:replicative DNA helicase domain protein, partial (plasmid) [Borreliella afzelii PKo]
SEIRRIVRSNGVDIIFIDYLGLISINQRNQPRFEQVAFISKTLKDLARTLKIPIVALSQLTRGCTR